jgi:hypothetical protein
MIAVLLPPRPGICCFHLRTHPQDIRIGDERFQIKPGDLAAPIRR